MAKKVNRDGLRGLPRYEGSDGQEGESRWPLAKVPGRIESGNPGSDWHNGNRNIDPGIDKRFEEPLVSRPHLVWGLGFRG
jgi:hypothetical protein